MRSWLPTTMENFPATDRETWLHQNKKKSEPKKRKPSRDSGSRIVMNYISDQFKTKYSSPTVVRKWLFWGKLGLVQVISPRSHPLSSSLRTPNHSFPAYFWVSGPWHRNSFWFFLNGLRTDRRIQEALISSSWSHLANRKTWLIYPPGRLNISTLH